LNPNRQKIERIAQAQEDGVLPSRLSPIQLLTAVRALAMSWHTLTPEMARLWDTDVASRRESVVETVRHLVAMN
jgi:hypothetical protein